MTSYHYDEILDEKDLPLHYCGISPCYRREAGTYGKDTRGLYRIHQFQKIEQVIICKNDPDISAAEHEFITKNSEDLVQSLGLPHHVVMVCAGDLGQPQKRKYDIECWMPSRNGYGENAFLQQVLRLPGAASQTAVSRRQREREVLPHAEQHIRRHPAHSHLGAGMQPAGGWLRGDPGSPASVHGRN